MESKKQSELELINIEQKEIIKKYKNINEKLLEKINLLNNLIEKKYDNITNDEGKD